MNTYCLRSLLPRPQPRDLMAKVLRHLMYITYLRLPRCWCWCWCFTETDFSLQQLSMTLPLENQNVRVVTTHTTCGSGVSKLKSNESGRLLDFGRQWGFLYELYAKNRLAMQYFCINQNPCLHSSNGSDAANSILIRMGPAPSFAHYSNLRCLSSCISWDSRWLDA